jgi:hypothetical protein
MAAKGADPMAEALPLAAAGADPVVQRGAALVGGGDV